MSELRSFEGVAGMELSWERVKGGHGQYALTSAQDLFATLQRERASGSLFTGAAEAGTWTFKRTGFFHTRMTVRMAGDAQELAEFSPLWNGSGTLEFKDGRRYNWAPASFWNSEWVLRDAAGADLLRLRSGLTTTKGMLTIEPAAAKLAELSLLSMFAWYLLLLLSEDAAVASTAAAAAAAS